MCMTSWAKLSKPKKLGGLGFRDIQLFNKALLAKQSWRVLTNPDCLLSRVLRGKYCHNASFLTVKAQASCSHGWRGILHGRDLLAPNIGKAIGDGMCTRVWKDAWIRTDTLSCPMGPANEEVIDLFVSDLLLRGSGEWNKPKIRQLLPGYAETILCMRPSRLGAEDKWVWTLNNSGAYSTKSGYYEAVKQQNQEGEQHGIIQGNQQNRLHNFNWNKHIWSVKTAPKIQVFLWKIIQDALPLGMALQRRGILTHPVTCARCGAPESADHLFLHCRFARQVWDNIPLTRTIDIGTNSTFDQCLAASHDLVCLPPTGVSGNIFSWVCWCIWTARNLLVFEDRTLDAKDISCTSIKLAREWQEAQAHKPLPAHNLGGNNSHIRELTSMTVSTLFTDAAWKAQDRTAGCGWIIHNPQERETTSGTSTELCVASPLMAEALAVREALLHAKALHLSNICLKSDNQVLVKALNSKQHPVELYGINLDIENLSSSFCSISFVHVSRNLNSAADALAKSAMYYLNP
ncbi:uncharacterized protein LOC106373353 [Brassica napus]|uniref:uncharacterized protein LOC106373353 n=1 Tax=Brassica napus TaxID=3708 RepID=UPI0006AA6270|nr:uncharacterized protein LOC106373353 [Brassica napus]